MKSVFPKPVFVYADVRSPIGKFGGSLKRFTAPQLASLTLKESISRAEKSGFSKSEIDFVFMGHARQAGAGPNPARQATIGSGLNETTPAITINQACASGLASIIAAIEKISIGKANHVFAGGVESMSNTPYLLPQARWGQKMGHSPVVDGMHQDGFFCPMSQMVMGMTVETFLAKELKISRQEQDEYALSSQKKAEAAWTEGLFKDEVFVIPAEGKNPGLETDEHRRNDTKPEDLAKLKPVFDSNSGSVTAGNSSGITDGSAFVLVSSKQAQNCSAEIIDFEITALDPKRMGLGPVAATQNLLKRQGLKVQDLEAVELNEAFAAQVIACNRELKIPIEKLNPRGGAIALGHPIGATGTRILVSLMNSLKGKPGALGLATLCVSGGMGVTVLVARK